jgi:transposase
LQEEGTTQTYIAQRLRVSQSAISRAFNRFRETGTHQRRHGQGRGRITTPRQDRFMHLQALRQRFVTSTLVQQEFSRTYGFRISQDTVRRRLVEADLHPYTPARDPLLTPDHRRQRLLFANDHLNWNNNDWANVLFTDESRFCLYSDDRRVRVYRRLGERYAQCNIVGTVSHGGGSVMVWGGISSAAHTDMVIVDRGRMTAHRYITEVVEPHVVPFALGDDFLLMDVNARPHIARVVQNYLTDVNIARMVWPPRSPDLNPIEHIWDNMLREVRTLQPPPMALNELSQSLIHIWNNIDHLRP